ncbi:MAG: hypothetical protein V1926_01920 [Candidatus Peregrinibacteria bacterium]
MMMAIFGGIIGWTINSFAGWLIGCLIGLLAGDLLVGMGIVAVAQIVFMVLASWKTTKRMSKLVPGGIGEALMAVGGFDVGYVIGGVVSWVMFLAALR